MVNEVWMIVLVKPGDGTMESRTDHVMTRFSSPGSPGPRESAENNRFLYTDIFMVHSRFIIYSITTLYHSIRSNTL